MQKNFDFLYKLKKQGILNIISLSKYRNQLQKKEKYSFGFFIIKNGLKLHIFDFSYYTFITR